MGMWQGTPSAFRVRRQVLTPVIFSLGGALGIAAALASAADRPEAPATTPSTQSRRELPGAGSFFVRCAT